MKKLAITLLTISALSAQAKPLTPPENFEGLQVAYTMRSTSQVQAVYTHTQVVKACNAMGAYRGNRESWANCYKGMYRFFYKKQAGAR